ncbi:uncharacterized protein OCT59_008311 [Rhizophagus irregularis]|uniref:uncharacterized protein n=1 Tax=Rhizophagus irregularis TaxID=588596 RepID=UPI003329E9AC|nr:hypothetical protein OCT59_008311 [Rhizophagus irregularis]
MRLINTQQIIMHFKEVDLKCLYNSQESIDFLINEANKYPTNNKAFQVLYGISQNPNTGDYILVQNSYINFENQISGNGKIDDFIQAMQLKINKYEDTVFGWIPYNKFNEIKEIGKNSIITVYSAIWVDGPMYYKYENYYTKDSNKNVTLKYLHNSQECVDFLINKAKKYPIKCKAFQVLYGISQNPNTGDYILVQNSYGPIYYKYGNYARDLNKNVTLKYLHNVQESIDFLINEANKHPTDHKAFQVLYGISQNPNTGESIDFLINKAKKYPTKRKAFQVLYGLSQNPNTGDYILALNWTSGNEKIDDFIQERQFKINNYGYNDIVFEWIPYNKLNEIKELGKNGLITLYSAIWLDGPIYYHYGEYIRNSNREVDLKCLHNSQKSIDSLIYEAKRYSTDKNAFQVLYGISQNPDTGDYIFVQNNSINLANSISGNEKIDNFIQEMQLKIKYEDVIFEWIPYNQFNEIKETDKNGLITVYSAIWKDGPLYKENKWNDYTRNTNKEVALKCLHNSQTSIDSLLNEAKKYPTKYKAFQVLYGISQNPNTGDYILVLIWTSGNEKIDDFIQGRQLKISNYDDVVPEWIPYNKFNEIKETGKNGLITVYSAIWKDGPLYKKYSYSSFTRDSNEKVALKCLYNSQESINSLINEAKRYSTDKDAFQDGPLYKEYSYSSYTRDSNEKVALKCLHNSQKSIDSLINEANKYPTNYKAFQVLKRCIKVALKCLHNSQASIDSLLNKTKKYPIKYKAFQVLYGISQNPDTGNYIFVQNNYMWTSGNKKIDDFIQKRQLEINNYNYVNIVLEWIPYNQFDEIKETGKNCFITVYSAIWNNGPLHYNEKYSNYTRDPNKEVSLKCLHSLKYSIDFLINEANKYSTKNESFHILKVALRCLHGSKNIVEFVINAVEKYLINTFTIWTDGPLHYNKKYDNYARDANKEVVLRCLHDSQNIIELVINEAKKYLTDTFGKEIFDIYGISQNPNTDSYILVLRNFILVSENKEIDDFIQEKQLKMNTYEDTVFEWIPYNRLNEIGELSKNGSNSIHSAIWKDGPLHYNKKYSNYTRDSNKKVVLEYLHNPENSIDFLINETKKYSTKIFERAICDIYGISQNPNTNNYILVLSWASGDKKVDCFIQDIQLKINDYDDIVFEWIQYSQFSNIKEKGKGGFSTVYSARWKDGPLEYDADKKIYIRDPNRVIALKRLHNSQNITKKFLNEVKEYSINKSSNILNIYGISQDPDTKEHIIVLNYAKDGNFNHWMNENYKYFALDICKKGVRPEITEPEAPRCYIDLMKKCWDLKPNDRPDIFEVNESITSFHKSYGGDFSIVNEEIEIIEMQFKKAEEYRKANLPTIKNYKITTHPQAIYTSRLLNPFTEDLPAEDDDNSQCLEQAI